VASAEREPHKPKTRSIPVLPQRDSSEPKPAKGFFGRLKDVFK
jgi:hypothetical protein